MTKLAQQLWSGCVWTNASPSQPRGVPLLEIRSEERPSPIRHNIYHRSLGCARGVRVGAFPPDDCVFLAKHFVSSKELAQLPMLVLPVSRMSRLHMSRLVPLARNSFSQDVVREYGRTAERIALTPWKFTKASEYLMGWVRRNTPKQPDRPEHLNFVLDGRNLNALKQDEDVDLLPPGWQQFAPTPPRPVEIRALQIKRARTEKT